jgi:hypothetical protein
MTQFHRLPFLLAVFLLFTCITSFVSAFTVSSINVNPRGYQAAGTPMTVTFVVNFPSRDNETFPQTSELQISTNLDEASWVPVLILDSVDTRMAVQGGKSLVISGWYLSYPSYQHVQLVVSLTGKIPENSSPRQDLLKIDEVDSAKNIVSTARVAMPESPIITLSTIFTPTKKPTTMKTFTPIPTDTPTQASPVGTGAGIIAIIGAALLVIKRR